MTRETVLVVADDPGSRRQCQAALQAAGFGVVTVADAHSGLLALARDLRLRDCEIAVVDAVLPGEDGLAAFGRLRAEYNDLAGLLLTSNASLKVAVEALNAGFGQVLARPVEPFALTEAVEVALAERRARCENARLQALARIYEALGELSGLHDTEELYRCVVRLAVTETSADTASLMLLDSAGRYLRLASSVGLDPKLLDAGAKRVGEPIAGWVVQTGVALDLTPGRPLPAVIRQAMRRPAVSAALCLPLAFSERPVGVLNINRIERGLAFAPGDVEIATVLANDAALSIQRLNLLREQAARERSATVGRLASTIIHDLRGPVTILRGAAELLADDHPECAEPLAAIDRQVDELDQMCEQLLSFARETSTLAFEDFAVSALLADAAADTAAAAAAAGVAIEWPVVDELRVEAVRSEVLRVLTQLVETALEAATGGRLRVGARLDGRMVLLELAGRDASPARWQLELDAAAAFAVGGAGLTLALARHVAERHRGRLEVETEDDLYTIRLRWPQRRPLAALAT